MIQLSVVTSKGSVHQFILRDKMITSVNVPSEYLIAQGQMITLDVAAHAIVLPPAEPGDSLVDARGVVQVTQSYDYSIMPTDRPLWAILQDAASHGREYPLHGTDCSCMDKYSHEITQHVSKAIPPDTEDRQDVHSRLDARWRISHLLRMVERKL